MNQNRHSIAKLFFKKNNLEFSFFAPQIKINTVIYVTSSHLITWKPSPENKKQESGISVGAGGSAQPQWGLPLRQRAQGSPGPVGTIHQSCDSGTVGGRGRDRRGLGNVLFIHSETW